MSSTWSTATERLDKGYLFTDIGTLEVVGKSSKGGAMPHRSTRQATVVPSDASIRPKI